MFLNYLKYFVPVIYLQVVDLSWCGGGGIVSKNCLVTFIQNCGSDLLTHLTFSSSPAVSDEMLEKIVQFCPNLVLLDLQSCNSLSSEGLRILHNLTKLEYLNVYRTLVRSSYVKFKDTRLLNIHLPVRLTTLESFA